MKDLKKKTIEYTLVELTEQEKEEIKKIEKAVKEDEKLPFDPQKLKKVKAGQSINPAKK